MNDGHLLVAFHGCDVTTRDALVSGRTSLKSSDNDYDWLGPGVYFFEGDRERASAFAQSAHDHPAKRFTAKPIATPAVVGAVLCVQRCLDMTTRHGLAEYEQAYPALQMVWEAENLPVNKRPVNIQPKDPTSDVIVRKLDNAVFRFIHQRREDVGSPYQMVRGAFRQGPELAPHSGLHRDSHIQIAVQDMDCVAGWFLVPGDQLLSDLQAAAAEKRLQKAVELYAKAKVRIKLGVDK